MSETSTTRLVSRSSQIFPKPSFLRHTRQDHCTSAPNHDQHQTIAIISISMKQLGTIYVEALASTKSIITSLLSLMIFQKSHEGLTVDLWWAEHSQLRDSIARATKTAPQKLRHCGQAACHKECDEGKVCRQPPAYQTIKRQLQIPPV